MWSLWSCCCKMDKMCMLGDVTNTPSVSATSLPRERNNHISGKKDLASCMEFGDWMVVQK